MFIAHRSFRDLLELRRSGMSETTRGRPKHGAPTELQKARVCFARFDCQVFWLGKARQVGRAHSDGEAPEPVHRPRSKVPAQKSCPLVRVAVNCAPGRTA